MFCVCDRMTIDGSYCVIGDQNPISVNLTNQLNYPNIYFFDRVTFFFKRLQYCGNFIDPISLLVYAVRVIFLIVHN